MHIIGLKSYSDYYYKEAILRFGSYTASIRLSAPKRGVVHFAYITSRKVLLSDPDNQIVVFILDDKLVNEYHLRFFPSRLTILPNYTFSDENVDDYDHIDNIGSLYFILNSFFNRSANAQQIIIIHQILSTLSYKVENHMISNKHKLMYIILQTNPVIAISKKIKRESWHNDPNVVKSISYESIIYDTDITDYFVMQDLCEQVIKVIRSNSLTFYLGYGYHKHRLSAVRLGTHYSTSTSSLTYVLNLELNKVYNYIPVGSSPHDICKLRLEELCYVILKCSYFEILKDNNIVSNYNLRFYKIGWININSGSKRNAAINLITSIFALYNSYKNRYSNFFTVELILKKIKVDSKIEEKVTLSICFIGEVEDLYHRCIRTSNKVLLDMLLNSLVPKVFKAIIERESAYILFEVKDSGIKQVYF